MSVEPAAWATAWTPRTPITKASNATIENARRTFRVFIICNPPQYYSPKLQIGRIKSRQKYSNGDSLSTKKDQQETL
jgi:hypothetical protein